MLKTAGLPKLWMTRCEFPFGGTSIRTRAFLAERTAGNLWLYSSSFVSEYLDHLRTLGMPTLQLLTHRDEASRYCNVLEASVFCNELERDAILSRSSRLDQTYNGPEHRMADDLVAYHCPGHTPGATCYLWTMDSGERVLFSGDTLFGKSETELDVALTIHPYGRNREDMRDTLQLVLDISPTCIVPGLFFSDKIVYPFDPSLIRRLLGSLT